MFCTSCGSPVEMTDRFCRSCGASIGKTVDVSTPAMGALPNYYRAEFEHIRDSHERYKGSWNWAAFFGGGFWAFARGLHKTGWFYLIPLFLILWPIAPVIHIVLGMRGNYMLYNEWLKQKQWPVRCGYGLRELWAALNRPIGRSHQEQGQA